MNNYVQRAGPFVKRLLGFAPKVAPGSGSLAYRSYKDAVWNGDVPEKYSRIVPYVAGERVLEIGAAEGVLALALARTKTHVIALEKHAQRHAEALELQAHLRERGVDVERCEMVVGDIREHFDLLPGVDTLVAVRMIYHLHEDIDKVFAQIARQVPNVVLCGNAGRGCRAQSPDYKPANKTAEFDGYASGEGMCRLLEKHGYTIAQTVTKGDEIVVGAKTHA